jgi:hypothetical protein
MMAAHLPLVSIEGCVHVYAVVALILWLAARRALR